MQRPPLFRRQTQGPEDAAAAAAAPPPPTLPAAALPRSYPPLVLAWREKSFSALLVWDYTTYPDPTPVPYTVDTSARTIRLDALIGRLALRAKQGLQQGPISIQQHRVRYKYIYIMCNTRRPSLSRVRVNAAGSARSQCTAHVSCACLEECACARTHTLLLHFTFRYLIVLLPVWCSSECGVVARALQLLQASYKSMRRLYCTFGSSSIYGRWKLQKNRRNGVKEMFTQRVQRNLIPNIE